MNIVLEFSFKKICLPRGGGQLGSTGFDLAYQGRTRFARVGLALTRVHQFKYFNKEGRIKERRDLENLGFLKKVAVFGLGLF